MLTGNKKPAEIDEAGKQLTLDETVPVSRKTEELEHSDGTEEVPDEIHNVEL